MGLRISEIPLVLSIHPEMLLWGETMRESFTLSIPFKNPSSLIKPSFAMNGKRSFVVKKRFIHKNICCWCCCCYYEWVVFLETLLNEKKIRFSSASSFLFVFAHQSCVLSLLGLTIHHLIRLGACVCLCVSWWLLIPKKKGILSGVVAFFRLIMGNKDRERHNRNVTGNCSVKKELSMSEWSDIGM